MTEKNVRIAVIGGSVRPDNFTMKAVRLLADHLASLEDVDVDVIDPATVDWPFPGRAGDGDALADVQRRVEEADGIVLATPEYHGSVSSVMKVVIENLGFPSRLAGKPISLLGVAAGAIGAIQSLGQLRQIGAHVGALVLPGAVSVAGVQQVFDAEGNCTDDAVAGRIRGLGDGLVAYTRRATCPSLG